MWSRVDTTWGSGHSLPQVQESLLGSGTSKEREEVTMGRRSIKSSLSCIILIGDER